jgi:hypothetical protein
MASIPCCGLGENSRVVASWGFAGSTPQPSAVHPITLFEFFRDQKNREWQQSDLSRRPLKTLPKFDSRTLVSRYSLVPDWNFLCPCLAFYYGPSWIHSLSRRPRAFHCLPSPLQLERNGPRAVGIDRAPFVDQAWGPAILEILGPTATP